MYECLGLYRMGWPGWSTWLTTKSGSPFFLFLFYTWLASRFFFFFLFHIHVFSFFSSHFLFCIRFVCACVYLFLEREASKNQFGKEKKKMKKICCDFMWCYHYGKLNFGKEIFLQIGKYTLDYLTLLSLLSGKYQFVHEALTVYFVLSNIHKQIKREESGVSKLYRHIYNICILLLILVCKSFSIQLFITRMKSTFLFFLWL